MTFVIIGAIVGAVSFLAVSFVSARYNAFTLPELLIAVLAGTGARLFIAEPGATMYISGWMLAMTVGVAIGFVRRGLRRNKRG